MTKSWSAVGLAALVAVACLAPAAAGRNVYESLLPKLKYGIVIQASESATTLHGFQWNDTTPSKIEPIPLKEGPAKKELMPGIPQLSKKDLNKQLRKALSLLENWVPETARNQTPIYFVGDGDFRILESRSEKKMVHRVLEFLQDQGQKIQFSISEEQIRSGSGSLEAIQRWLALTSLHEHLDKSGLNRSALIHISNSSTELAFVPTRDVYSSTHVVVANSTQFDLFATSYAGFGWIPLSRAYAAQLVAKTDHPGDPCMPSGQQRTFVGDDEKKFVIRGTPDFNVCKKNIAHLFNKLSSFMCFTPKCLRRGQEDPRLPEDAQLFAVDELGIFLEFVMRNDNSIAAEDLKAQSGRDHDKDKGNGKGNGKGNNGKGTNNGKDSRDRNSVTASATPTPAAKIKGNANTTVTTSSGGASANSSSASSSFSSSASSHQRLWKTGTKCFTLGQIVNASQSLCLHAVADNSHAYNETCFRAVVAFTILSKLLPDNGTLCLRPQAHRASGVIIFENGVQWRQQVMPAVPATDFSTVQYNVLSSTKSAAMLLRPTSGSMLASTMMASAVILGLFQ